MNYLELKYKIQFILNTDPITLIFVDNLSDLYAGMGYDVNNILGIVKITGPNGILHKNTGWDTNSFAVPDINGGTSTWLVADISLPAGDDGNPLAGAYLVEYKLSTDNGGSVTAEESFTYGYAFVEPVVDIGMESVCKTSILTVTDETEYAIEGETIDPETITRSFVIRYPLSAGDPPGSIANVESDQETVTIGPNVWTGNFDAYLETELSYIVEVWEDDSPQVEIITTVSGEETHAVECDECSCAFYACYNQINTRYLQAQVQDFAEADRLARLRNDLSFYWNLYQMALNCDQDTGWICSKMQELAQSENCQCSTGSSSKSVEVIPWGQGGGGQGTPGTLWFSGGSAPSAMLGTDGDFYLRTSGSTTKGDVYKKVTGSWVLQMNINGEAGERGQDAVAILHTTFNVPTTAGLYHDVSPKTLVTYNAPANTLKNNRDMLVVTADFYMFNKAVGNGANFDIVIDRSSLGANWFGDHETELSESGLVHFEIQIMRQSQKSFHVRTHIWSGGKRGSSDDGYWTEHLVNDIDASQVWGFQVRGWNEDANMSGGTYNTQFCLWNFQVMYLPGNYEAAVASPTTPAIHNEQFTAGSHQTIFTVTGFTLNDNYIVIDNGVVISTGHSRSGNSIIFDAEVTAGHTIVIIN